MHMQLIVSNTPAWSHPLYSKHASVARAHLDPPAGKAFCTCAAYTQHITCLQHHHRHALHSLLPSNPSVHGSYITQDNSIMQPITHSMNTCIHQIPTHPLTCPPPVRFKTASAAKRFEAKLLGDNTMVHLGSSKLQAGSMDTFAQRQAHPVSGQAAKSGVQQLASVPRLA